MHALKIAMLIGAAWLTALPAFAGDAVRAGGNGASAAHDQNDITGGLAILNNSLSVNSTVSQPVAPAPQATVKPIGSSAVPSTVKSGKSNSQSTSHPANLPR